MARYGVFYRGIVARDYRTGKDAVYGTMKEAIDYADDLNISNTGYYIDKIKSKKVKKVKI